MDLLARLFDAPTQRALERVGVAAGWQCLEVGGGGGSVARWLAARVGASGRVLCTDINTRIIESHRGGPPNLEVRVHDIANDPLPAASFDLVHAPPGAHPRDRARARAGAHGGGAQAGGWLVIEDFDTASIQPDASVNRSRDAVADLGGGARISHAQPGRLLRPAPARPLPRARPARTSTPKDVC
jgi:SAM-dependent methyltransferase